MGRGDGWTRSVGWLKLTLPLVAIGLLATLFLLTKEVDPVRRVGPGTDLAQVEGFSSPRFAGQTAEGHDIVLSAVSARPDPDNARLLVVQSPEIEVTLVDGRRIVAIAPRATYDADKKRISLEGGASLTADNGYVVTIDNINVTFDTLTYASAEVLVARGSLGTISANQMTVAPAGERDGKAAYDLVFTGNVRLSYQPAKPQE